MKDSSRTGSRLFFIEFLIVLFFFLIVGTVCIRIFSHAHLVTQNANALSGAQNMSASIAEMLELSKGDPEKISAFFPGAEISDGCLHLYYDKDFLPVSAEQKEQAFYTLSSVFSSGQNVTADISVTDKKGVSVYTLSVTGHVPLTRKEVLE